MATFATNTTVSYASNGLVTKIRAAASSLMSSYEIAQTARVLNSLSDRQLDDLGLARNEIYQHAVRAVGQN